MLAAALVAQEPRVSASVDRHEVLAGELVTLTIRVEAGGGDPVRIADPTLFGLEIRGSRDVTQVRVVDGAPRRVVTRELRLLAVSVGRASIGPVRVTHGVEAAESASIIVTVGTPASPAAAGVAPRVRALLDTLPAPSGGADVVVEVLAIPASLQLGAQLDLVTLAWFPREARLRLSAPPTLDPPSVRGVWAYQQTTTPGIVTSRAAGGRWYDLYASHQVVFPLTPGSVHVGRATIRYIQPVSLSLLSREVQYEVQSESVSVGVREQPAAGRPAAFTGAAGQGLRVTLSATPTTLPPGGAATVRVGITGVGNVALWPEPEIGWPAGLRVYPGDVAVEVEPREGLIGGAKEFTYLVVADSAGTHAVPGVSYPYFDAASSRYQVASTPGLQLVAPLGTVPAAARPAPPPLLSRPAPGVGVRVDRLAEWVWVLIFAMPPLAVLGLLVARRLRAALPGPAVRVTLRGPLETLDRDLREALTRIVGEAADGDGPPLTAALRAAGLDPTLAAHATRVRERVRHAVFGPKGASDPAELSAEVQEVLRALTGETPGMARRALLPLGVLLVLAAAPAVAAQAPRPEELYDAGAFRAAADSFAARTLVAPRVPAYWYNLGAAYYRLGDDGRARAAWLRAARLAPRDPAVRRALDRLPSDALSRRLAPVAPVRPGEALLAAAVLWILGWVAVPFRRTRRLGMVIVLSGALVGGYGALVAWRYGQPAAVVLHDEVPMRSAPYGSASSERRLYAGSAVRVLRAEGVWLFVERGDARGWVLPGEVARL